MAEAEAGNDQKTVIREFIEIYRDFPCLWNVQRPEYHDRSKKNAAYEFLIMKLNEIQPNWNKDSMKKKINSLRTNRLKEKKKVQKSLSSGAGANEVYVPDLWYYHMLDFLDDTGTIDRSISNISVSS